MTSLGLLNRSLPAVLAGLALAGAGCKGDTGINQIPGRLIITPGLYDAGDVPVGATHPFTLQFANRDGGAIEVVDIQVFDIEGEYFSYTGDVSILSPGQDEAVGFEYTPLDEGYHRSNVIITLSGARQEEVEVTVRGHGALAAASVWPLVLDFGPIEPPFSRTLDVTVSNDGDVDFDVNGATISNGVFSLTETWPVTIAAGDVYTFSVVYEPTDTNPDSGTLQFDLGEYLTVPAVTLRGNDCENGDPAEYDTDGDGFTSCGGDCDDGDDLIFPGGVEVCDGEDNNCNGTVDEGTLCWDDDGDGYCEGADQDGDGQPDCLNGTAVGDCNDGTSDSNNDQILDGFPVNPGATEIAGNGIDDDCDGVVDQGSTDADGDGYSPGGGDCNDANGAVYPGAPELPDRADNDCDNTVDEGTTLYDDDGDCYCNATTGPCGGSVSTTCTTVSTGDCDDTTTDTYPGATELADYADNDCDRSVDEGTIHADDDGDGFNDDPAGGNDCDDTNPNLYPGNGC